MKKFLSTILAVVMVLSSMAMVVSADETLADGIYVGTTKYDTFTAAQTAAAANTNKEIIISGTVEFGSRQGISVEGLHLRGINNAKIIPSATYGDPNNSATNKKGLLNIGANNVKVSDVTFDGSVYGDTISQSTDFIVLRINEGTGIELSGVTVTGSPKTLISVGTSSTSASVTAENLYCQAEYKDLPIATSLLGSTIYSDIDVAKGSFTLNSGEVNGFIGTSGGTFTNGTENHYTLTDKVLWIEKSTTTTLKHYVESYAHAIANGNSYAEHFVDSIIDSRNLSEVADMVEDAEDMVATDRETVELFVDLLEDAYEASNNSTIQGYINTLNAALNPSTGA